MGSSLTILHWFAKTLLLLLLKHHNFVYSSAHANNHLCPTTQQLALFNFKQNLSISTYPDISCDALSYPKTNEWEMSGDCCTWNGVACDPSTGDVIGLDLSCSYLEGDLHSKSSLFHLPHLQRLNLAFNAFDGSVLPPELGRFATSLTHLNLSHCRFSGPLPWEIRHLSKLVLLDFSYNDFSLNDGRYTQTLTQLRVLSLAGTSMDAVLPKNLSSLSSLTFLDLSDNGLRGKLPREIFHLPNLQTLWLSGNSDITGVLSSSNWSSSSNLRELDLSGISMLPEISDIIGSLVSLKSLKLVSCNMSGAIPISMLNHTHLRELDLSRNMLDFQIPDGFANFLPWTSFILTHNDAKTKHYFPSWIANLTQLAHLDLSYNSLSGPLPSSNITRLQKLKFLDLSQNSLSGEIPSWVFDLPLLEYFNIYSNSLNGELREFRFTTSLQFIRLSANELTGSLPESILLQPDLQVLALSSNKLSGIVVIEMFSVLKKLESLSLSHNQFSVRVMNSVNNTFPNLKDLGLSSLKMKEFPYFLRTTDKLEHLDLSDNQIHGLLPEWLCNSSRLDHLDLSGNMFSSVLPLCLGNLGVLSTLDISMNNFRGIIPSTFANLSNLDHLNLHGNQFQGDVRSLGNCTSLQVLDLGSNKLKDTFPLWLESLPSLWVVILRSNKFHGPVLISNVSDSNYVFSSLEVMDLSNNRFKGEIPNALTSLLNLQVLDLHKNNLHGTIPSMFARGNNLWSLNLHDNHLQGTVPSSLANCAELKLLDIGNNHINDTFPSWLATLLELHVLVLSHNRFHGPINTSSTTKTPFPKLRIFDVSNNEFTGLLPELFFKNFRAMEYVNETKNETEYLGGFYQGQSSVVLMMKGMSNDITRILTILTTIDLSSNQFKGQIPNVLGNLKFLTQLNLSHNSLGGRIPSYLGNLTQLEVLDLNSNKLEGEIPQELTYLTFLGTLNLSYNNLTGRIPVGKQFNTFMNNSYCGNPALCGFPLSNCEKGEKSQPHLLQGENDSGFMDGFTWKVVLLGYGCGTVLGFIIGCVMFSVRKPKWFTEIVRR